MKPTPYMVRVTALARKYCEASGLPPRLARLVCGALRSGWAWDVDRLPLPERDEFDQVVTECDAVARWVFFVWQQTEDGQDTAPLQPAPPEFLAAVERANILAHLADLAASEPRAPVSIGDLAALAPGYADRLERHRALEERVIVRGEELRAFLHRLTRDATGRDAFPDPVAWLALEATAQGERLTLEMIEHGCFHILREQPAGVEEETRDAIQRRRQERSGRLLVPQAIYRQFYPETDETRAKLIRAVERGEVALQRPEMLETIQQASARASTREFADLTMSQIRALVAVMAILTDADETDGGRLLAPESITVTATEFYRQAEVPSRQTKLTRALLAGMVDLTDRRVFLEVREKDATGKTWVGIVEKPPFEMVPLFAEEDTTGDLLAAWERWRMQRREERREGGKAPAWEGPMPRQYVFTLPNLVRQSGAPLIFSRDVLASLEEGARHVRGGKLTPRDWALWLEITRTRQAGQLSFIATDNHTEPPITSFRCYVDRRAFLRDYHGDAATHHRGRLEADYLASVEVLRRGRLTLETRLDVPLKKNARERRDIFVPNPEKLLSIEKRATGMLKRQAARLRKPKGRKKSKGGTP